MSAIARQQKTKAEHFCNEANAKLNKGGWFANKERKNEEAAEFFDKAGNAYKVGGFYFEGGEAYQKAADIYEKKLENSFEASKALQNAGTIWIEQVDVSTILYSIVIPWIYSSLYFRIRTPHSRTPIIQIRCIHSLWQCIHPASCFKKVSPQHAVECYNQAILLLTDAGRVMTAAKLSKECAELYENEQIDLEEKSSIVLAIETYEQAAELFLAEDAKAMQSQCLAKVAELCSAALDPPDLPRAGQLYDDLGRRCLDTNLLKFNAKGYFLQALLCALGNNDSIAATQAMQRYESLDYTFGDSREGKFARALIDCVEGFDPEGFATACFEYDRVSKLDPWKTSMLVRVKQTIDDDGAGGRNDEDDVDLT